MTKVELNRLEKQAFALKSAVRNLEENNIIASQEALETCNCSWRIRDILTVAPHLATQQNLNQCSEVVLSKRFGLTPDGYKRILLKAAEVRRAFYFVNTSLITAEELASEKDMFLFRDLKAFLNKI